MLTNSYAQLLTNYCCRQLLPIDPRKKRANNPNVIQKTDNRIEQKAAQRKPNHRLVYAKIKPAAYLAQQFHQRTHTHIDQICWSAVDLCSKEQVRWMIITTNDRTRNLQQLLPERPKNTVKRRRFVFVFVVVVVVLVVFCLRKHT